MKIKSIFLSVIALLVSQSAFAAELVVYNLTGNTSSVDVSYGSNDFHSGYTIDQGGRKKISSGIHHFTKITWDVKDANGNRKWYGAEIPSSRTMLRGMIVLQRDGTFEINFDANGSSESRTVLMKGLPLSDFLKKQKN